MASSFTATQTSHWELGVSLILNFWQPLIDAVSCQWGGPDSPDKRDWLCGYIADLWGDAPDADADYVETALLQVMEDEFEVVVDDDSAYDVSPPSLSHPLSPSSAKLKEQKLSGSRLAVRS